MALARMPHKSRPIHLHAARQTRTSSYEESWRHWMREHLPSVAGPCAALQRHPTISGASESISVLTWFMDCGSRAGPQLSLPSSATPCPLQTLVARLPAVWCTTTTTHNQCPSGSLTSQQHQERRQRLPRNLPIRSSGTHLSNLCRISVLTSTVRN